jgi:hypothetical protein
VKRNLYFFLYPAQGSFWRWHLAQLRRYWPVFNGRKIVVVATDRWSEPADSVARELRGLDARIVRRRNDLKTWQTASFVAGLSLLRSAREDEITFYAHSKGASHRGPNALWVRSWAEAMYLMNLSAPELIDGLMRDHDAVGCFRQKMPHGGSVWHYAGAFFWFKHSALFAGDWRDIRKDRYGGEAYPGRHIPLRRSCSLTPRRHYSRLYLGAVGRRECRRWLQALRRTSRA